MSRSSRIVNHLCSMPELAHSVADEKTVKEIMLSTGGQVMAQGILWDIKAKPLGAGTYRLDLKRVRY